MKKEIETIKEELKNLAEDKKAEMSVNVYNYLWDIIQGIDYNLTMRKNEKNN